MISYKPFWETLKRKSITQYQLMKYAKVSAATLDKLRKGGNISIGTAERLCKILKCNLTDIVEVTWND